MEKIKEIFCGLDENKNYKTTVTLAREIWTKDKTEKINDVAFNNAKINITINNSYVYVDLDFNSRLSTSLTICLKYLEEHINSFNNITDNDKTSVLIMTILPNCDAEYCILAINPTIFSLTTNEDNEASVVRLLYELEDFEIYKNG